MPTSVGEDYASLRQLRLRGDYGGGLPVGDQEAREAIASSDRILDAVRGLHPELGL